jgi:hypothetical protein
MGLDLCLIILVRVTEPVLGKLGRGRRKTMKHAIRISILMLGLMGTYVAAAVPQVPAPDGGPILTCPDKSCKPLAAMMK